MNEEVAVIESRFIKLEDIKNVCPDGIRLFFKNIDVSSYNKDNFVGETTVEIAATDTYTNYANTA